MSTPNYPQYSTPRRPEYRQPSQPQAQYRYPSSPAQSPGQYPTSPPQQPYPPYTPPPTQYPPPVPTPPPSPYYPTTPQADMISVPYEPETRRVMNKSALWTMVFLMIVTIFCASAIFLPWYNIHGDVDGTMEVYSGSASESGDFKFKVDLDMPLNEGKLDTEMEYTIDDQTQKESLSGTGEYEEDNVKPAMHNTLNLNIVSILIVLVALIFAMLAAFGFIPIKISAIITFIAMLIVLSTLIYFTVAVPTAIKKAYDEPKAADVAEQLGLDHDGSLYGSSSKTTFVSDLPGMSEGYEEVDGTMDLKWSWGPAIGWYLIIISFIFALFGFISMLAAARVKPELSEKPILRTEHAFGQGDSRDIYYQQQSEDEFLH